MRHATLPAASLCFLLAAMAAPKGHPQVQPASVTATTIDDVLQAVRSDLQSERSDIMKKNLALTDAQQAKFAPVFAAYLREQNAIMDEQLKGVQRYIEGADTLDDAGALALLRTHLDRDVKMAQLREHWLPRFQQAIGTKLAVRALQVDRRLSLTQQLKIVTKIPLVH